MGGIDQTVFEIKDTWTTKREKAANTNIFEKASSTTKGNHNPITNPLPVNIQNPYILKQINNIKDTIFSKGETRL